MRRLARLGLVLLGAPLLAGAASYWWFPDPVLAAPSRAGLLAWPLFIFALTYGPWEVLNRAGKDAAVWFALAGAPVRFFGLISEVIVLWFLAADLVIAGALLYVAVIGACLLFQIVSLTALGIYGRDSDASRR